jgi:hypothetical protein
MANIDNIFEVQIGKIEKAYTAKIDSIDAKLTNAINESTSLKGKIEGACGSILDSLVTGVFNMVSMLKAIARAELKTTNSKYDYVIADYCKNNKTVTVTKSLETLKSLGTKATDAEVEKLCISFDISYGNDTSINKLAGEFHKTTCDALF